MVFTGGVVQADAMASEHKPASAKLKSAGGANPYEKLSVKIVGVVQREALEVKGTVELHRRICRAAAPTAQRAGDYGAGSGVNGYNLSSDDSGDG